MRRNIRAPQIENAGALTNRVTKTQERWPGRSHRTEGRNHYHLVGLKYENMTVPWSESAIPWYPPRRSGLAAQKCGTNMVLLLRSAAPRQGRSHNPITWHRVGLRLEGRRYRSLTMRDRRMCLCICVYRLLCYLHVGLQMLYVRTSVYARTMISYVHAFAYIYDFAYVHAWRCRRLIMRDRCFSMVPAGPQCCAALPDHGTITSVPLAYSAGTVFFLKTMHSI